MVFIRIILFLFFINFIFVNSNILINPVKTNNQSNPLNYYIFFDPYYSNYEYYDYYDNYHQSWKTQTIKITADLNLVKFNGKSYTYSSNLFFCIDQNNNKYLFSEYYLYSIIKDYYGSITQTTIYKSIPNNCNYIGYIKENAFTEKSKIEGARCTILNNEIILYGINNNIIYFYYTEAEISYDISFEYEINSLSCKLIQSVFYLCAFNQNKDVYVIILGYFYQSHQVKKLVKHSDKKLVSEVSYYDNIFLYDTNKKYYKALCVTINENYDVKCKIIYFDVSYDYHGDYFKNTIEFKDLSYYQNKFSINEDHCYLTGFYSEILLCCGEQDRISCVRKNIIFETIKI